MKIKIKATANVLGLKRGDVADVEVGPTVDALVEQGYFVWLDAPVSEPVFVVTEKVKERKPRAKKVVEEPEIIPDPVHVDYMNWADDGGVPEDNYFYGPDES